MDGFWMQINEQILFAQATAFVVGNWSIGFVD